MLNTIDYHYLIHIAWRARILLTIMSAIKIKFDAHT